MGTNMADQDDKRRRALSWEISSTNPPDRFLFLSLPRFDTVE
jgi:hypothetical protein